MKFKIFLLTLILTAVMYFATNYLFVDYIRDHLKESAKDTASQTVSLYKHINKAYAIEAIRAAETLAEKTELLNAFDDEAWKKAISENPGDLDKLSDEAKAVVKEIEQNVQVELNVINKMYDKNDAIFVVDKSGNVVSKNLDGILRGKNFSDKLLISSALKGTSNRDIIQMLGKTFRVTAAPMIKDGEIIGAYCSADVVNSETAKEVMASLTEEASPSKSSRMFFGFFTKEVLLGSTMPTEIHENFKKYIVSNPTVIEQADNETGKVHQIELSLCNENFYGSITRHPSLSESNDMFYVTLTSIDLILEPVVSKHGTLILLAVLSILAGLIAAIILDEQFNRPINKFMENMLEIINGNTSYRFDNDTTGLESNLNQNANMMISTLLGEKVSEKIEEIEE